MTKGIVQIAPLLAIAFLILGTIIASSYGKEEIAKYATVLKSDDSDDDSEEGRTRTDIYEAGRKLRIETRNGATIVKIENEDDEVEDEIELEDEEEFEVPATGGARLKIKSRFGKFVLKDGEVEAETKFPLAIDLATNELVVTTPSGVKRVAVLPQQAVDNMIRVGHVDVILPTPLPSPTAPAVATPSVSPEVGGVEIVEKEGEVVYVIRGAKREKFLGLFEVFVARTLEVSAENGQLLNTSQSLIDRILDLLSA